MTKLKIGDKVKLIKHGGTIKSIENKWTEVDNLLLGDIYTVHEISKHGNIVVRNYFVSPKLFEKVTAVRQKKKTK